MLVKQEATLLKTDLFWCVCHNVAQCRLTGSTTVAGIGGIGGQFAHAAGRHRVLRVTIRWVCILVVRAPLRVAVVMETRVSDCVKGPGMRVVALRVGNVYAAAPMWRQCGEVGIVCQVRC